MGGEAGAAALAPACGRECAALTAPPPAHLADEGQAQTIQLLLALLGKLVVGLQGRREGSKMSQLQRRISQQQQKKPQKVELSFLILL